MTITSTDIGWDDSHEMPLSRKGQRQQRIAELYTQLAAMRPARRCGDAARFARLEGELMLLLSADLIANCQTTARSS
jgi:hypothetical protein